MLAKVKNRGKLVIDKLNFIDVSFSDSIISFLMSVVGKKFEKYRTDPYDYVSSVYGIVGVYVDGKVFKLTNFTEQQDHFGTLDDVAVLKFEETGDNDIKTCVEDGEMINHPVNNEISEIKIINEEQILKHQNQAIYKVQLTRGIIFVMKDGLEIAFEKPVWFSEMIDIHQGYDVLNKFATTETFIEEWTDCEGYEPECSRSIISLK